MLSIFLQEMVTWKILFRVIRQSCQAGSNRRRDKGVRALKSPELAMRFLKKMVGALKQPRRYGRYASHYPRSIFNIFRYSRFQKIKKKTRGMLSAKTYAKIYDAIYHGPDLDVVEIGAHGGAISVCVALALKNSGKTSSVIVVERCEGSEMDDFGIAQDNLFFLENIFREFGVRDKITIFPREITYKNGEEVKSMITTARIACLIHDADGFIDRDFYIFWPILVDGGMIIIDDYAPDRSFRPVSDKWPMGGTKARRTWLLVNKLVDWGLLNKCTVIDYQTLFAFKPKNADFGRFDRGQLYEIVDKLRGEYRRWASERNLDTEWRTAIKDRDSQE